MNSGVLLNCTFIFSNDDKNKSIFEISSDDEWIPLKRDARQTKKALKVRKTFKGTRCLGSVE